MLWYLAEPLDAGVFHGGIGIEALSDGVGDDRLTFFLEQFNQPLLFSNQVINPGRLVVEESCNGASFTFTRLGTQQVCHKLPTDSRHLRPES